MGDPFRHLDLFVCPDDGGRLRPDGGEVACASCGQEYPVRMDRILELLPKRRAELTPQTELERKYGEYYRGMFEEPFAERPTATAWGAIESIPRKKQRYILKQQRLIARELKGSLGVLCDISAGSGNYPFALADRADLVILCDLGVDNLNHLLRRAGESRDGNIVVARCDYHASPLRPESIDTLLCTDTLCYGREHERHLLKTIARVLKKGGRALVNFKNKVHRNPFKKPIVTDYGRGEVRAMIAQSGFERWNMIDYHQELAVEERGDSVLTRVMKKVIPPTRFYVLATK